SPNIFNKDLSLLTKTVGGRGITEVFHGFYHLGNYMVCQRRCCSIIQIDFLHWEYMLKTSKLMKKTEITFVCPIEHWLVAGSIAESDDLIIFSAFHFSFYAVQFFVAVTVRRNKFTRKYIVPKLCF